MFKPWTALNDAVSDTFNILASSYQWFNTVCQCNYVSDREVWNQSRSTNASDRTSRTLNSEHKQQLKGLNRFLYILVWYCASCYSRNTTTRLALWGSTELSILSFRCNLDSLLHPTNIAQSPSIFLNMLVYLLILYFSMKCTVRCL